MSCHSAYDYGVKGIFAYEVIMWNATAVNRRGDNLVAKIAGPYRGWCAVISITRTAISLKDNVGKGDEMLRFCGRM